MMHNRIIIICGPTASGKSKFAIEFANQYNGVIVNADSMQLYKGLEKLTASPPEEDKKAITHHLYNFLELDNIFSVTKYQEKALNIIKDISKKGYLPIVVGGTGLYINSLIKGINLIPNIDTSIRMEAETLLHKIGKVEFYNNLIAIDPLISDKIHISDKQRMIRAYEVIKQTGKSIKYFQSQELPSPLSDYKISTIMLSPERKFLYQNCNDRFLNMINSGAMEEVQSLYKLNDIIKITPLGFKELVLFYRNEISLENAIILAQNKTRQYAKRQVTWFNNQIKEKLVVEFSSAKEYQKILGNINDIIRI